MWILYAAGSSFFAGITAILAKCGIKKTDSDVATAIRTFVVLIFSWLMVMITGTWTGITNIGAKTLLFLVLSGLATGASWLCYYRALQDGLASVVVPIDKLSILITILFSRLVFGERLNRASLTGLIMIVAGTILLSVIS
jgi:transporter family protein